jgi:hypothetical protein
MPLQQDGPQIYNHRYCGDAHLMVFKSVLRLLSLLMMWRSQPRSKIAPPSGIMPVPQTGYQTIIQEGLCSSTALEKIFSTTSGKGIDHLGKPPDSWSDVRFWHGSETEVQGIRRRNGEIV